MSSRILNILSLIVLSAVSFAALTACSAVGCTENQNSVPLAGFYSMPTGQAIVIDSISVMGNGAPGDSMLVRPSQRLSQTYLPFRSAHVSSTFIIKYEQKALAQYDLQDRVTFYYDTTPWFASEDCGAMYHYRITRVDHTMVFLDSVGVSDSLITNIEKESIQLFFRTGEEADNL